MADPAHQAPKQQTAAAKLRQALARLTEPAGAGPAAGQESLSAAVLREISETVLPRQLTLVIGQQPAASLTLAQRRLAGFSLAAAADSSPAAEDPAAAAQLFAARLRRLEAAAEAQGRGFRFRRRPCAAPQGAGSCSARMLEAALSAAGHGPLDRFRAQAADQAAAWLYCPRGSGSAETAGPAPLLAQLEAVRSALTARAARPASARVPVPKPDCLLLPVSPQQHILAASDGGALLLLALPPAAARAQAAAWSGLYG